MTADADDLAAWIADLRRRVARGELDGLGHFAVLRGRLDVGLAARIMLADLDHFDNLPPEQRRDLLVEARRRMLLRDFARLRAQIG